MPSGLLTQIAPSGRFDHSGAFVGYSAWILRRCSNACATSRSLVSHRGGAQLLDQPYLDLRLLAHRGGEGKLGVALRLERILG